MSQIKIGLIGGTGLGEALGASTSGVRHEVETPFGRPSDAIIETEWAGVPVLVLSRHGPGHVLNPSAVPFRANVFALKQLGCTHIIASGAVGSLREQIRPRDLVIPDQVIDRTVTRVATFFEHAAVHVEFGEPFCPVLRRILVEEGTEARRHEGTEGEGLAGEETRGQGDKETRGQERAEDRSPEPSCRVHDGGCYVCMEGPAFSSRAESLMHRLWGGDLIGMTAMPEAKLAREAEISYALVALVTDYDCWKGRPLPAAGEQSQPEAQDLLREIMENLDASTRNAVELIRRAVQRMTERQDELATAPAQKALELAIWSDKSRIAAEEVERLRPLWGRYFKDPGFRVQEEGVEERGATEQADGARPGGTEKADDVA
jgi:5'-methylthioadenosine phosphorylase